MSVIQSAIANVVAPLKELATKEAARIAYQTITGVLTDLEAHDWNLNLAAPYPKSGIGKAAYRQALAKRSLYQSLTICTNQSPTLRPNDVDLRGKSESGEAAFLARSIEAAAASYDQWVSKLSAKVGDVVAAELAISSSVWGSSVLTVTKPDGSLQHWKTQMIVNCSVLGKHFNQWPTRLVK